MSVGDILREQTFTENCNRHLLLHRAAKRKNQTMEKVFFNRQLVFHTEMSDYSSSRQPVEEKNGAIYRLEELHNAKDTMQRCIQTAEMHEQDLCHKNKTKQLKAEKALQTFSHKAEMLKQNEEIRQVSRQIEAINLMETKLIASIRRETCFRISSLCFASFLLFAALCQATCFTISALWKSACRAVTALC